ncbi:Pho23p PWA37_003113 [Arxiozyma heterogenica]|uniref:Pho23p n=1 Tax=Arxiozyma heterogenica TaxID=278026 RepID=UPI002EE7485C
MSAPANLYPGLNDLADIFEEIPIEIIKYLTLLHEIDAKCTNVLPTLSSSIDKLLDNDNKDKPTLMEINTLLEELMPSLEEKMHVSSLMCELINTLDKRLELAYEVAIRNEEIPSSVRLGLDNHPAMHLHHELIQSLNKPSHSHRNTRSTQNTRSEAKKETQSNNNNKKEKQSSSQDNNKRGTTNTSSSNISNNNNSSHNTGSASATTSSKRRSNNSNSNSHSNGSSNANSSTSRQQKGNSRNNSKSTNDVATPTLRVNEYGEPVYCYCNQVAYGEMVGCDGENCELEWFHLPCIGLTTLPKGKWYCDTCKAKVRQSH